MAQVTRHLNRETDAEADMPEEVLVAHEGRMPGPR